VLRGPDFDPFWLYNALDRAMKGGNLEQELDRAQGLTEAYLACYQEKQQWLRCARQVDPTYAGDALLEDSQ
jgi:hypothetical protein